MRTTKKLYQWDTNQKLVDCVGKYVDYPIGDEVYRIDVIDKECIIPDELLQVSGTVKVYECMEYGTVKAFAFYINPRPMPPDYVFTPAQRLTFEGLVKKVDETIEDLQKRADSGEFNGSDYVITESDYDAIAAKTAGKLQPTIGELARTLETEKTDREKSDISLQKDISGKLSEPVEGLEVGKYFRVAQVDENGHAVLEVVDAKTIGVQDVQVNGDSIVNGENGVAGIKANGYGIGYNEFGFYLLNANNNQIIQRKNSNIAITPVSIDYAVKAAMCDGKGAAWTADEQAAARERIGIPGDYEMIENIITTEETNGIERSVEPDGTPYSFISVFIKIHCPAADYNGTLNVRYFYGYKSIIAYVTNAVDTVERFGISKVITVNGYLEACGSAASSTDHASLLSILATSYSEYLTKKGYINKIFLSLQGSKILPVGTEILIYGVRA